MKLSKRYLVFPLFMLLLFCSSPSLHSQETTGIYAEQLAPLSRLVGGEWHLGDSYQTFSWGVGKQSIKTQSYFLVDGKPKLVSEGIWFWHPGEKKLKGYSTAIDMPVSFFDYTTTFEGNTMTNELTSYSPKGNAQLYSETWEFTDDDHYEWTLFSNTPDGQVKIMGGNYSRE